MAIQNNFPAIKPTLLLDFSNTKALDSKVTFTRASTATFYGTQTAKAEENLLLQSQAWATTPWFVNIGGSVTAVNNSAAAPDGTTTATSLTFSAQFGSQAQSVTTIAGLSYTFSFWARRISGNTALHINHFDSATGANTAFTITNDWVRYSVTVLGRTGGGAVQFGVQDRNASGFGEILVWGAQLEQRSAVTAYTATTTQPITNYIPVLQTAASGVARFDHNPTTFESLGLEIEEQRTNLLTYSEQFNDASWTKFDSTITANTIVAPDGTLTGDKLVENTANGVHAIRPSVLALTSGTTYTFSVYAKAAERSSVVLFMTEAVFGTASNSVFDLTTGTVTSANGATCTITPVGNGWYRCTATRTATISATDNNQIRLFNGSITYTGNGFNGLFIWGAQLEAGAFPTSYIQTVASQVTRAADAASMTGTNFSSWYNAAAGTVYVNASGPTARVGVQTLWRMTDGTANNVISGFLALDGTRTQVVSGGVTQADQYNLAVSGASEFKYASGYAVNNITGALNAVASETDFSALIPATNNLQIGSRGGVADFFNGTIRKIAYYPVRIQNAQLQGLTS